ncbi:MAG TPA: TrkA C-terminal domain-containing protein, partial [Polyangiaceae bacterium]|nr:TrkA C-terminal domain-containing protein [Polyangiaceae bacterium]
SVLVALAAHALGFASGPAAGVFAGALTNTPALAAVVQSLKSAGATETALSEPVLAYSICYPLGVLLPLVIVGLSDRWFKVDFKSEPIAREYGGRGDAPIVTATAQVDAAPNASAGELRRTPDYQVNFGRVRRDGKTRIVADDTRFEKRDLVTVVGTEQDVKRAVAALGRPSAIHLELDRSEIDYRRMFVSNPAVTERPLRELELGDEHAAVITRVRRGDVDLVPDADFELLLGDRVRVTAARSVMPSLGRLFGDSLQKLAEVDVITFGIGIGLGLVLGAIPLPLPGGQVFSLGNAGGPLVAGLCLGRVGRTGPLVWAPPYGVNLTLRQFGLVLFLAGVGVQAGAHLAGTLSRGAPVQMLATGAVVTLVSASSALFVGHRLLRIPLSVMVGTLAGVHTQPAVLAFATQKTQSELPNTGYATVFPLATISKIVLAQLLLHALR